MVENVCSCAAHQQPRCVHFRMGTCATKTPDTKPEDEGPLRPNLMRPINKIVEIVNEAATCSGMNKEDTDALRAALVNLVVAIKS